jgi:hypothetical protein
MHQTLNLKLVLAFGMIFAVSLGWPELCYGSADPFLDGKLKILDSKIDAWEHSASIIGTMVFATVLVGIVVAAMQPTSNSGVMKVVIATLSVIAAALAAFNHQFFPADDREYKKAARQARVLVNDFELQLARFTTIDDKTRESLYTAFQTLFKQVEQIEENIYGSGSGSSSSPTTAIDLISSAYAGPDAQGAPAWVANVPSDEMNFYFLGKSKANTFDEARKNAIEQAKAAAAENFSKLANDVAALKNKPQVIDQLVRALVSAGEITQTFVSPDAASGDFTGYALLRISKGPARFAAESVFVRTGEPYEKKFLNTVQRKN